MVTNKSATLACRRLVGSLTYVTIDKILSEVDNDFDLPLSKITSTVTNNGSTYKKAYVDLSLEEVCDAKWNSRFDTGP